jgi:AmmeMemoRadiSam system protein B
MTHQDSERIRPSAVAGQFYPGDAAALRAELAAAFTAPLGPGTAPAVVEGPRTLLGLVVPHAGYVYSGPGAAWGYATAARDGRPAAAVILGVNHHMLGAFGSALALSSATGWETPLGVMPVATELGEALRARDADVVYDDLAHTYEHSLEVQVPFLQYIFGELPILPIAIADATREAVFELGEALAALAREQDLLLIASTDFSHQVPQETAETQDRHALDAIARVDAAGLLNVVAARRISMCGYLPTAAVLTVARALGITRGEVLHYHTSGDVIGDRRRVVGYGTAALYRPADTP